jgi:adenylosuccinate synthase
MKGWKKGIYKTRDYDSLPQPFLDYVKCIEDLIQADVVMISTGMDRTDTIFIKERMKTFLDLEKIMDSQE